MTSLILASIGVFLVVIILLVIILLVAKSYLSPSGEVTITMNGEQQLKTSQGGTLLGTLSANNVFLSSACGGKGSCGQCRCQVLEGGGEILPTETGFFSRKEQADHWRLGCQVKVKQDMSIKIDESILGVKEWECEVISNKNVATFIKEFIVALPPGEHMDFVPGSYAQIKIPTFSMDYDKDIDKSLIGDEYLPAWEKFGLLGLKCRNDEPTIRAYSMANYPAEGDRIMLTVRIATPPFKPKDQGPGFMDVMPEKLLILQGVLIELLRKLKPLPQQVVFILYKARGFRIAQLHISAGSTYYEINKERQPVGRLVKQQYKRHSLPKVSKNQRKRREKSCKHTGVQAVYSADKHYESQPEINHLELRVCVGKLYHVCGRSHRSL